MREGRKEGRDREGVWGKQGRKEGRGREGV